MKILLAADIFPPQTGGPATYVVTLANELVKAGDEVWVVSLNPNSDTTAVSCFMSRVSYQNKFLRYLQYFWLLLKQATGVDVIYAMGPVNAGLPALLAARLRGKKFVVKVVGDYAWEQYMNAKCRIQNAKLLSIEDFQNDKSTPVKYRLLRWAERYVVRKSNFVIVPSKYLAGLVNKWGGRRDQVQVIYNAVDFQDVEPIKKPAEEKWIVTVARLVPWKGIGILMEVVSDLKKEFPKVRLKIVGDGPVFNIIKTQVKNLSLEDMVELTGQLSRENALSYVKTADVFVLNSAYEGLPHVVLEAMSYNIPVAISDVGGNPEILIPGKVGYLFPYNDKRAILQAIRAVLYDEERASSQQLVNWRHEFYPHYMVKSTKYILEKVCAN